MKRRRGRSKGSHRRPSTCSTGEPGCTHDSADCPAWFPGRYSYYCPFVADGAVYVLNAPVFHTNQT